VNLSCNFFKGRLDVTRYIDWVHRHWLALEKLEQLQEIDASNQTSEQSSSTPFAAHKKME
jgi:hypothetical protein